MSTFKNWVHTQNPFTRATRNSFQKLYVIATDHTSKLSARISNADIDQLHQRFLPFYNSFKTTYQSWDTAVNTSIAYTQRVDALFKELYSGKLEKWDTFIQYAFGTKSPEYTELMYGGRLAFRTGKIDIRIKLIENLANAVKNYTQLSTIEQEVSDFAESLVSMRDEQQKWEQEKRHTSGLLHEECETLCRELFRNLANIIALYPDKPNKVVEYFQMDLVRRPIKKTSVETMEEETTFENEPMFEEEGFETEFIESESTYEDAG